MKGVKITQHKSAPDKQKLLSPSAHSQCKRALEKALSSQARQKKRRGAAGQPERLVLGGGWPEPQLSGCPATTLVLSTDLRSDCHAEKTLFEEPASLTTDPLILFPLI